MCFSSFMSGTKYMELTPNLVLPCTAILFPVLRRDQRGSVEGDRQSHHRTAARRLQLCALLADTGLAHARGYGRTATGLSRPPRQRSRCADPCRALCAGFSLHPSLLGRKRTHGAAPHCLAALSRGLRGRALRLLERLIEQSRETYYDTLYAPRRAGMRTCTILCRGLGASGRSPAKTLSMIRRRARVHGRRLAWRFGWQRSGDRSFWVVRSAPRAEWLNRSEQGF